MKKINEILKDLGIEEKEIEIYLAALEGSPCSVIDLAKRTNMKRTSVYNFLNGMIRKGIILPTAVGSKFLYSAALPEDLVHLLDKKKERLMEILPELSMMFIKSGSKKPKIKFYEGVEGIKKVYHDTLTASLGSEQLYYSSLESVYSGLSESFWKDWYTKRVARKIFAKGIMPSDSETEKRYSKKINKEQMRDVILVPQHDLPIENEMIIYENKIALVSFGEDKMGVIIESRQIAGLQRAIFNLLWKALKKK